MHRLLARQLKRLNLDSDTPPTPEQWSQFLGRIERAYIESDQDRYLIERSLTISSQEMQDLYEQLRRSSESQIAAERDKFQRVVTSLSEGLCSLDENGRVVYINPAGNKLLNYTDQFSPATNLLDHIRPPEKQKQVSNDTIWRHLQAGVAYAQDDGQFQRRDGSLIPISYSLNPIIIEGKFRGAVLTFQDIRERKRAEEAYRRQTERLRLLHTITTSPKNRPEQIYEALKLTTTLFRLELGVVSRIVDDVYTVAHCYSQLKYPYLGQVLQLSQTYCDLTLAHKGTLAISHFSQSAYKDHPSYPVLQYNAYISTTLRVNQEIFGTLSFARRTPRQHPFSEHEKEFLELLAQWIGAVLEREQTEQALRDAEEEYRTLYENVPIGIYRSSIEGLQVRANPALAALNGYESEAEQVFQVNDIAKEWYVDPLRREAFKQAVEEQGRISNFESEIYRHKTRERIWISESAILVRDEVGNPLYYEGTVQDITERKRVEEALQRSRTQFKMIVEASPIPTIITRFDGTPIFVNDLFAKSLGFTTDEILALPNLELYYDRGLGETVMIAIAQHGELLNHELRAQNADGQPIWVLASFKTIVFDDEPAILTAFNDITDQKNVENELRVAKEAAEAASRAKSTFLANMSHELRTPLAAIMGYAELLREQAILQEYPYFSNRFDKILVSAKHLLDMISDILDLSKIEAGRIEMHRSPFSVRSLVDELTITIHPLVQKNGNSFSVDYQLPAILMYGDETKIRQILLNLLDNAAKFTEGGEISLTVALQPDPAGEKQITFIVADTGIGISDNYKSELFDVFVQGDPRLARFYEGVGLGLAICKRYCDIMNGELLLQSEVGVGTTFTLILPFEHVPDLSQLDVAV